MAVCFALTSGGNAVILVSRWGRSWMVSGSMAIEIDLSFVESAIGPFF